MCNEYKLEGVTRHMERTRRETFCHWETTNKEYGRWYKDFYVPACPPSPTKKSLEDS